MLFSCKLHKPDRGITPTSPGALTTPGAVITGKQETGSRKQEAGSRKQEAGSSRVMDDGVAGVSSVAVRQPPMGVNIEGCDQVAPRRRGERISPAGHLIVAHYEVVGNGVKDSSVPEGRSNPQSSARTRPRERKQQSIVPCGTGRFEKTRPTTS
jgi:hypothetical protein